MSDSPRCKKCGHSKEDLVHPENWGDHQRAVMAVNAEAKKMMDGLAHPYEPIPENEL
jgi:hypothetical protein